MSGPRRLRQLRRRRLGPELASLALAASTIAENSAAGTIVGAILGATGGSALALVDDAGGRFAIAGTNLVTGAIPTDHETAASHTIAIRETLAGYANSPRDTTITVTVLDVAEGGAPRLLADNGDRLIDDSSNPLILEAA